MRIPKSQSSLRYNELRAIKFDHSAIMKLRKICRLAPKLRSVIHGEGKRYNILFYGLRRLQALRKYVPPSVPYCCELV